MVINNIYYTLQSSAAVLGVYCNMCNALCNYCYSWPHQNIAFWTHKKASIMCPECASKNKDKIYRKVHRFNDIPINRSYVRINGSLFDMHLFINNEKNKENHNYNFCTEEEELEELNSGIIKKDPICRCGKCNVW